MKRLCLSAVLIIATIGSLLAMQSDNRPHNFGEIEAQKNTLHNDLKKLVKNKTITKLLKEKKALESFREKLTIAVNEAASELTKYEANEPTRYATDLLISKFDTAPYIADIASDTTTSLMKIYTQMMKDTYSAYAAQYEDKENIVPIESRMSYTWQDYTSTYNMLVIPFIDSEIARVESEIAEIEAV